MINCLSSSLVPPQLTIIIFCLFRIYFEIRSHCFISNKPNNLISEILVKTTFLSEEAVLLVVLENLEPPLPLASIIIVSVFPAPLPQGLCSLVFDQYSF